MPSTDLLLKFFIHTFGFTFGDKLLLKIYKIQIKINFSQQSADYNYTDQTMICCRNKKKGKHSIEAYNKIKIEDKKQYILNAQNGIISTPKLIQRVISNKRVVQYAEPTNRNELQSLVKGSLEEFIKKKVLKSDYDDLIKNYSNSNQMWTDPDFPPHIKSFGSSNSPVVWKRVSEIIQNPTFVYDNFTPSDLLQGRLGNCYFLSAVAGLAQKPYRIKILFPNTSLNNNGIYMARLLHKGVFQEVVVDDYFPCTPNGELIGAQPAGGMQIWVMILEKCWAKVFGSYNAIDRGLPNQVLRSFSAAPTFNYRVTKDKQWLQTRWQIMMIADQKDQTICCRTQMQTKKSYLSQLGLVGGHAYTILGVYEQSYRIINIRNPWGNVQWKGAACDNDKNFWSRISADEQLRLGYNTGDDGIFFMLYLDFEKYFLIVDICQINDNANYFYTQSSFQLSKPQCFDLNTGGGDLTITVTQTNKRQLKAKGQKSNIKYAQVIVILARDLGNNQFEYIDSRSEDNNSDFYLSQVDLPAGKYVICCFVEGNTSITNSTVSIYSEANFFIIQSTVSLDDFLYRCFLSHARNNQSKQIFSQNPLQWACFDVLTQNCGIGYSAFHVDPLSTRKLGCSLIRIFEQWSRVTAPFQGCTTIQACVPPRSIVDCIMSIDIWQLHE